MVTGISVSNANSESNYNPNTNTTKSGNNKHSHLAQKVQNPLENKDNHYGCQSDYDRRGEGCSQITRVFPVGVLSFRLTISIVRLTGGNTNNISDVLRIEEGRNGIDHIPQHH